jgi:hypothetical protein
LEERAAQEGIVYTEVQLAALEAVRKERESHPDEIERRSIRDIFSVRIRSMCSMWGI